MRALQVATLLAEEHEVVLLVPEPGPAVPAPGADAGPSVPPDLPFRVETYATRRRAIPGGVVRAALEGRPWQSGLFHQPDLSRRLAELAPGCDLAVLQLVRLAGHADDLGETPFLVDFIDSLSLNFERRARYETALRRPLFAAESRRLLAAEEELVRRSAGAMLVCDRDRAWLADRLPADAAGKLWTVPLGMPVPADPDDEGAETADPTDTPDTEPTEPTDPTVPAAGSPRLVLTGNLGYFPTVDGVRWWLDGVWPALRRDHPELRLTLAGARPARALRRAARARRDEGVELLDTPPSLEPVLASATAAIAPLRAGSGVPVKVLEAWAAGVPVVASRWTAAGAGARAGFELLVAESVEEWREAVRRLLEDPGLGPRLAEGGRLRLRQGHSEAAVRRALGRVLGSFRGSVPGGVPGGASGGL